MNREKEITYLVVLILMAVYFSLFEGLIPKPFPWMKLGLANIATLLGMQKFGYRFGLKITIYRILIYSLMVGTFLSANFIISFTAGIISTFIMGFLFSFKDRFSIVAISCFGGVVHNISQIGVVYIMFFRNIDIISKGVQGFVFLFILSGMIAGLITGIFAYKYRFI